jgi:putative ABC transport system permease protein
MGKRSLPVRIQRETQLGGMGKRSLPVTAASLKESPMSLWKIAWRNMQQRALASWLTGLSMALGVALVVAVLVVYAVLSTSFTRAAEGYNMIVGAKGGKLQLVLNTVYHLSTPIENIPWTYYEEFITVGGKAGRFAPMIEVAIPYCLGDNYEGYRVVGTTSELFTKLGYGVDDAGQPIPYQFAAGRNFDDKKYFEGVIGSIVAHNTGLKVGDSFEPTHGVTTEAEQGHKHDPIKVVGVLAPTGTPNDRALFMNVEGFFLLEGHAKEHAKPKKKPAAKATSAEHKHDHDDHAHEGDAHAQDEHAHDAHEYEEHPHEESHEHAAAAPPVSAEGDDHDHAAHDDHEHAEHEHAEHDHAGHDHDHGHSHAHKPLPKDQREVTAILLRTKTDNPIAGVALPRTINKEQVAQAVLPIREIYNLFNGIIGPFKTILLCLGGLVVAVAGIGVMVSIYNSMSDRQRDIAIMRSLGASRNTVMWVVLLESIMLSVLGGLGGVLLGHGLIAALNPYITAQTGVSIGLLEFATQTVRLFNRDWHVAWELVLIPGLVLLASVVGFLPAMAAYRTDVAKALTASP